MCYKTVSQDKMQSREGDPSANSVLLQRVSD